MVLSPYLLKGLQVALSAGSAVGSEWSPSSPLFCDAPEKANYLDKQRLKISKRLL